MHRPMPTFVVAGAGRAGTTGLVQGLREHSQVFVTQPKEPHYLALHGERPDFRGPGDEQTINQTAVTEEAAYRDLFPTDSSRFLALGEASVSTLYYHRRALPELVRLNPEARVVVLLREPVARAWSSFMYLRGQDREPEADFLAAVAQEERRRAAGWHHLWHYTAMSHYADSLEAVLDAALPGHARVWFHDDLERDFAGTLAEVLEFLGLPHEPGVGESVPRVNVSGAARLPWLQHSIAWAAGRPALRTVAGHLTTWRFREAVRTRLTRRGDVPGEVSRVLAPVFRDDLDRVRRLLEPTHRLPPWLAAAGEPAV